MCGLIGFDLGGCIWGMATGWMAIVPWWAWLALAVAGVGVVWKFAGWPGLIALAGVAGFIFGRTSKEDRDEIWPHPDDKPVRKAPKRKRPTIFDRWR